MAIHSSLVDPAAPVHVTLRMRNVLQSASAAKVSTITSCIACKISDDIAVDSESKP